MVQYDRRYSTFFPASKAACICGSGKRFKRCCREGLCHQFEIGGAVPPLADSDASAARRLQHARLQFSHYWVQHAAHRAWAGNEEAYKELLDIDIRELGSFLEAVLYRSFDAGEVNQLTENLSALSQLVDDERWRTRVVFVRALSHLYPNWNEAAEDRARSELSGVDIASVRHEDILQVHYCLFGHDLGLVETLARLEPLIELSKPPGVRLQYRGGKAVTLINYGDPDGARRELASALSEYEAGPGAQDVYGLHQYAMVLMEAARCGLERATPLLETVDDVLSKIIDSQEMNNLGLAELEFDRGVVRARTGKWEEALSVYQRAQSLSHRPQTSVYMAEALAELGRPAEALGVLYSLDYEALRPALKLDHCISIVQALEKVPDRWEATSGLLSKRLSNLQPQYPEMAARIGNIQSTIDTIAKDRTASELSRLRKEVIELRGIGSDDRIRAAFSLHREMAPTRQTQMLPRPEQLQSYLTKISVEICAQLIDQRQLLSTQAQSLEDIYTAYLLSLLQQRIVNFGWNAEDQQHGGRTANDGPERGRRDLVIRKGADAPFAIFEALRVSSMGTTGAGIVDEHVNRLVVRYDQCGAEVLVVIVYAEVVNFLPFCEKYVDHFHSTTLPDAPLREGPLVLPEWAEDGLVRRNLKLYQTKHLVGGDSATVVHLVLHLRPQ